MRAFETHETTPSPKPPSYVVSDLLASTPAQLIARGRGRKVALLIEQADLASLGPWSAHLEHDDVHLLVAEHDDTTQRHGDTPLIRAASAAEVHQALSPLGLLDVIVDLRHDAAPERVQRWRRAFLHLRTGGRYVIASSDPTARLDAETLHWARHRAPDNRELLAAVGTTAVGPHAVVLGKRLEHFLKMRDAGAGTLLASREPMLQVTELDTRPGGHFTARARVHHHISGQRVDWPTDTIAYPELHLRRYEGDIRFHGGTLMYTGHSILPDSFRWHASDQASNPNTVNAGVDFARIPPRTRPRDELDGTFYQLDPQYGGFGHVMTEVVGRLWGWDAAKAADPGLRALFFVNHLENYRNVPKYKVLRGYGLADEDIVAVDHAVRLRSLSSGTVMWHNAEPHYVHPGQREVWQRLGDGLIDRSMGTSEKIFVSRSARFARRTCRNAPDVEALFAAAGFTVVYPEDYDLGQQTALFAGARVIAGFSGSGLFNMMFARELQTTIVLSHDAYYHRNEHLFTALLGGDVHYFWSRPDMEVTGADVSEAVESSWAFDLARHGAELEALLASL